MEWVNLTPHDVVIFTDGRDWIIPRSGMVARVESVITPIETIEGIPITRTTWGRVNGIPAPKDGVMYIVSSVVMLNANRDDVVAPNTSQTYAVRDAEGQIIGVRALQKA